MQGSCRIGTTLLHWNINSNTYTCTAKAKAVQVSSLQRKPDIYVKGYLFIHFKIEITKGRCKLFNEHTQSTSKQANKLYPSLVFT